MSMLLGTHRAVFAMPHHCVGQAWTEAIAVLNLASAELRLQAAQVAREVSPRPSGSTDYEPARAFEALQERAERMDELAHWLRDNPDLPAGSCRGDAQP